MRTLIFSARLPTYLWEEALSATNYISNGIPHRALYQITSLELYLGKKPDISHFKVFGSTSYVHVQHRNKLQSKSKALVLVGYDEISKAFRCFDYSRKKVIISRDV
jgi:hypothetical protein